MEITTDCLRMLSKVGFMACLEDSLPIEAKKIFSAFVLVRPEQAVPYIGLALANMGMGDFPAAVELLENKALKIDPGNDRAKVLLSMALKMEGRAAESLVMLNECLKSEDSTARNLANKLAEKK